MDTPDLYGGAAVTTKNIYREVGKATFTEVAGAGTITTADPGDKLEVVFGQGSDDDTDEPYGCKAVYTVPCKSNPALSAVDFCKDGGAAGVVDDAVYTDLVNRFWDPEDGTAITSSATVDIDNGDVMNIKTEVQGAYEEDFGNRFTPCDNQIVIKFNTTGFKDFYATNLDGSKWATDTITQRHSTTTGYTSKAYKMPVLKSNELLTFYLVADATDSGENPSGGATGNVTVEYYANNWFINNDVTPARIDCGVNDEDGNAIGAATADTNIIYLEDD